MSELTPEQITAMNVCWDEVCKDIRSNGADLFIRLFTAFPKYQEYFKDLRGIPIDELRTNRKLRVHGTRVMHALSSMVKSLDELDIVAGIMVKTTDTHYNLNVTSYTQYEDLFSLLPEYLASHAGEKYNDEAREGWNIAIAVLTSVLKERIAELDAQTATIQ